MVSSVSAQTDIKKVENKLELDNSNNKNGKTLTNYWTLANKADLYYDADNVGIGTSRPNSKLDVSGTISAKGLILPRGNTGDVLTAGSFGTAYWAAPSTGGSGGDPSPWSTESNGISYNSGTSANVGIGKASSSGIRLVVNGKIRTNSELNFASTTNGLISFGSSTIGKTILLKSLYGGGGAGKASLRGMSIDKWGNVGIGIDDANDTNALEVIGRTKTTNFQMTSGAGNGKILVSNSVGLASWKSIETVTEPNLWEDSNGNIYRANGKVGIGTNNPQSPLDIDFGSQTIGLRFVGATYSGGNTYSDFLMETSHESGKPELTFKTSSSSARYNWACQGVDKMTLEMVYYGDPSATRLTFHDGTFITKK
ncbi:hypothetical protein [Lentimicrobium sp. S6]|uniref:hypothetical protein n=1 Tax=Lentimicrobium sp. S6 TaxID=2735872 RepID=UPI001556EC3B|nr:hypothetical protein [Lentimicrobium sp. S6]NPD45315.1 hypothetical protein [Lentimicrobium sp. S6]